VSIIPALIRCAKQPRCRVLTWWMILHAGFYAVTLPARYHRNRYMQVLVPVLLAAAVAGVANYVRNNGLRRPVAAAILTWQCVILSMGARLTIRDIDSITRLHLTAANWLKRHATASAVVAADDVGVLGYITDLEVIDLRGLVTPAYNSYAGDPRLRLDAAWMDGADYLLIFDRFYPDPSGTGGWLKVATWEVDESANLAAARLSLYERREAGS
ncbi:hypothetical protein JW905_11985, partial [bacterium]|nr:hypothetical protein [candidate division CSSED10-310 bacterium]